MRRRCLNVYSAYDGLALEVLLIQPKKGVKVKGVVQFSHGMCENKERYEPLMEYLCERGFACVIHDHRGHGKSVKSTSASDYEDDKVSLEECSGDHDRAQYGNTCCPVLYQAL